MLRKIALTAIATAALGAAALAPTSASAWDGHGGWRHAGWHGGGWHGGWGGPRVFGGGGCLVRRVVPTPWGPRWRLVNRCY